MGLNFYAPGGPTPLERTLASAIIVAAFFGTQLWKRTDDFGFLPVVLVVYSMMFAIPIFTLLNFASVEEKLMPSGAALDEALALSLLGLVCILIAYFGTARLRLPQVAMAWPDLVAVRWVSSLSALFGLGVFIVTRNLASSDATQAFINLPSEFLFLGVIALFLLQLNGRLSVGFAALLWMVLIPVRFVIGMAQGEFALGFWVLMGLVIAYTTVRRRFPWIIFAAAVAAFLVLQPVKGRMRKMVFIAGGLNTEMSQSDKIQSLSDTVFTGMALLQALGPVETVSLATQRLNDIVLFAGLIGYTPEDVPYWGSETYKPFVTRFIPRFLYPEKPLETPGNDYGHKYGMLNPSDYITSVNVPQLNELYGNFGPWAVPLGCLLIGFLYRVVNNLFVDGGLGAYVTAIYVFSGIVDIENTAASRFGAIPLHLATALLFAATIHLFSAFRRAVYAHSAGLTRRA